MYDDEQDEHLDRVTSKLGPAIVCFFQRTIPSFHADELRKFITGYVGPVAPGSPDRVMRSLRQRGVINYRVVDRRNSLYEILPKRFEDGLGKGEV